MFDAEMRDDAHNSRVIGKCYQSVLPEPYGSGFWFVFFGVIVPITPHTQTITCYLNKTKNNQSNLI